MSALFHCNCEPGLPQAHLVEANPLATLIPSNGWFLLIVGSQRLQFSRLMRLKLQRSIVHCVHVHTFCSAAYIPKWYPYVFAGACSQHWLFTPDLFKMISHCCEQFRKSYHFTPYAKQVFLLLSRYIPAIIPLFIDKPPCFLNPLSQPLGPRQAREPSVEVCGPQAVRGRRVFINCFSVPVLTIFHPFFQSNLYVIFHRRIYLRKWPKPTFRIR